MIDSKIGLVTGDGRGAGRGMAGSYCALSRPRFGISNFKYTYPHFLENMPLWEKKLDTLPILAVGLCFAFGAGLPVAHATVPLGSAVVKRRAAVY